MSLVACEHCRGEVDPLAEECPHCKWAQPERFFQAGVECRICPRCKVRNYISHAHCRSCGELLQRPSTPMQRWQAWQATKGKLLLYAFIGAVLGASVWLAYLTFILQAFDDPTMRDPIAKAFVFCFHGFLGGGGGWIAGFIAGAVKVLIEKSRTGR